MASSAVGQTGHKGRCLPLLAARSSSAVAKADAESLGGSAVSAQRPPDLSGVVTPARKAAPMPEKIWEQIEKNPAGAPVDTLVNEVMPFVQQSIADSLCRSSVFLIMTQGIVK